MQCPHAFGDAVRAGAGDVHNLVEVEVQVAEVGADDVPVCLFGDQLKGNEVDEDGLHVLGQSWGGGETVLRIFARGGLRPAALGYLTD